MTEYTHPLYNSTQTNMSRKEVGSTQISIHNHFTADHLSISNRDQKHQALNHNTDVCNHPHQVRLSREDASDGPLDLGSSTSPGLGARDGVAGDVTRVDIVLDAGVGGSVEGGATDTVSTIGAGVSGAGAGDLNVDTLRVGLGAVLLAGGVESDDLVAEDVVAWGERLGDADGPLVAVGCALLVLG